MRHVRSLLASSTALVAIYNLLCQPVMRTQACPPVTTDSSCGEHPHSGRDGSLLTWGMSYRTNSAQECCDRCKLHPKGCNSWTFCGLPICWGLDTGNNHTYGECWLRRLKDVHSNTSWRQRGQYTQEWLRRHRKARPGCKLNQPWTCSPTWVPYTSGALGGPPYDAAAPPWVTGGAWGRVWTRPQSEILEVPSAPNRRRRQRRVVR